MNESNPLYSALTAMKPFIIRDLMIGLPGHVLSYDPDTQRAVIECGIQRHTGGGKFEAMTPFEEVPVQFSGTAEWTVFHELPPGTEGYIHFSQRAIDNWLNAGGPAEPFNARMFNASDAFFSPGYRSMKTVIPGLPTDGIGMSSKSGDVRIHLTAGKTQMVADGSSITASAEGVAIDSPRLTHNGVNIGSVHQHGGVISGPDKSGPPE